MLATPARRTRKGAASKTVCGRRHCTDCKRWRLTLDYDVSKWDAEKRHPKLYAARCKGCRRAYSVERYRSRPRRQPCQPEPPTPKPSSALEIIARMSKEDRHEYELAGCLPLGDWSIATEDHDLTPVPQGCPSCYLIGGHACITCPDKQVAAKVREARRQGLVSPV